MGKPLSRTGRCRLAGGLLCLVLAGCSLVSLKSPERPLSQRDLDAHDNALRWQLAAVAESRRAATRITPMLSLVDSWALGVQMQAFVGEGGAGAALFGNHQQAVRDI